MVKQLIKISLILSCLWFANKAFSQDLAFLQNNAGGKIIITNEPCVYRGANYSGLFRIYNYSVNGESGEGCYRVNGENIWAFWFATNQYYYYPISNLTFYKK